MIRNTLKAVILVVIVIAAQAGRVQAQNLPSGSYSSWSESQKQQAGATLKNMCEAECSSYLRTATAGGQRGAYEAAACTLACYVNNLPDDYPRINDYKAAARENYNNAKSLGSNAPVFLRGR